MIGPALRALGICCGLATIGILPLKAMASEPRLLEFVRELGSDRNRFPTCTVKDLSERVAELGESVTHALYRCTQYPAANIYLTFNEKLLSEAHFVAQNRDGEKWLLDLGRFITDQPELHKRGIAISYLRYPRNHEGVSHLTVTWNSFSWDILPGATLVEELRTQAAINPNVELAGPLTIEHPGLRRRQAWITEFGRSYSGGLIIVHLVDGFGLERERFYLWLGNNRGPAEYKFSTLQISEEETTLKLVRTRVAKGKVKREAKFLRLNLFENKVRSLKLSELSISDEANALCLTKRGPCWRNFTTLKRDTATPGGFFSFTIEQHREQFVLKRRKHQIVESVTNPIGRCIYNMRIQDYHCEPDRAAMIELLGSSTGDNKPKRR